MIWLPGEGELASVPRPVSATQDDTGSLWDCKWSFPWISLECIGSSRCPGQQRVPFGGVLSIQCPGLSRGTPSKPVTYAEGALPGRLCPQHAWHLVNNYTYPWIFTFISVPPSESPPEGVATAAEGLVARLKRALVARLSLPLFRQ